MFVEERIETMNGANFFALVVAIRRKNTAYSTTDGYLSSKEYDMQTSRISERKWVWPPRLPRWKPRERTNFRIAMLFLLPWTIGFILFTLYPMVASFVYSFNIYHARQPLEFVGLQNYAELLKDDLFWKSLSNTLYIVGIGVPLTLFASFLCAVLLNLKVAGQSIYRVIYFLPSIVPTVASTILWLWILNPQVGI